jgi:hypothetical protein
LNLEKTFRVSRKQLCPLRIMGLHTAAQEVFFQVIKMLDCMQTFFTFYLAKIVPGIQFGFRFIFLELHR